MKKILFFISFFSAFSLYAQKRTVAPVYTTATQTLTNKSIDADANTITNIDNADIKAGAAIAVNKLAALTGNRVMVTDGSGFNSASSITTTTLGYLDPTSSIQAQLDNKLTKGGDANAFSFGTTGVGQDVTLKLGNNDRWFFDGTNGYLRRGSGTASFGLQLYGTGAGSAITVGDLFDASTPYATAREKGGIDTDQWEFYAQKGLYFGTGTLGSTARFTIQQDGDMIYGGETQVVGAEHTFIGDADISGNLNVQGNSTVGSHLKYKTASTPSTPANATEFNLYYKANKFIIQYNDGGIVRYKYLDLTGTGVTWVHTTTAP